MATRPDLPATLPTPAPKPARRHVRVPLRVALAGIILASILATAGLIHAAWSRTARENVADVVTQLNAEIIATIYRSLDQDLSSAAAMREALRTVFFQGVIETTDEAKREFMFLSLLQSQPVVSWVSFGFPDGSFFGAEKNGEDNINMVEVHRSGPDAGKRRIDSYVAEDKDITFQEREFAPSDFDAKTQPWYADAVKLDRPTWTEVEAFPTRRRRAVVTSMPLQVYREFKGVIAIAIELDRLSRDLAQLRVGQTGTAFIITADGEIVAFPDARALGRPEPPGRPTLQTSGEPLVRLARRALASHHVAPRDLVFTRQLDYRDPDLDEGFFVTLSPLDFRDWRLVTVVPEKDFLATIDRNIEMLLYALAAFTLVAALLGVVLTNRLVASPLSRIVSELRHVESFRLDRIARLPSRLTELDGLSEALVRMARGLSSFQRYIPTELVRTLVAQGVEARPGGHRQVLTVLFSDLAGFTGLSETLGDGIVPVLAAHLGAVSAEIARENGTIDKFIGDAVMAFWGAPLPDDAHAVRACRAAVGCARMMQRLRDTGESDLHMRIGLNTGSMLVGNIGSEERLNYTVIGDAVNVASRLESLNKRYGTEILIGEDTRRAAGDAVVVRRLDTVSVYGRLGGIAVFELLGLAEEGRDLGDLGWVALYEAGLDAYAARRWEAACDFLARAAAARPGGDPASTVMIARCRGLLATAPPADWSAVIVLEEK